MPNRLVILYNQDVGGWSETHWRNNETIATTVAAADTLLALRFASLNYLTYIYGYRVTQVPQAISRFKVIQPPLGGKMPAGDKADFPWTGAFFSITLANGKTLPYLMRGITDVTADDQPGIFGDYTPNNPTKAYLDALFKSGVWGTRLLDKDPGSNPSFPIESVVITGNQYRFTATGHNLAPGNWALFTKMRDYKKITRRARVVATTVNTFTVELDCVCGTFVSGEVRREKLDWIAYNNWDVKGVRKRDTGRPFGLLSGRRRA